MTTPWPPEVLDCAKRLAKSLGYEDSHVMEVEGVVEVYRHADSIPFSAGYDNWYWFELDPRDPTVWSALIGINGVTWVRYYKYANKYEALVCKDTDFYSHNCWHEHPGIAVCEAYNALKGNARGVSNATSSS